MSDPRISTWLEAASASNDASLKKRGTPTHRRHGAPTLSSPADRMVELLTRSRTLGEYLTEAVQEVRRLEKELATFTELGSMSFGGVSAAQTFVDMWLWEAVLNDNPQLRAIVEIGTWHGGMSWFLWAQSRARTMGFVTYDAVEPERAIPNFQQVDVFANPEQVEMTVEGFGQPVVIFCDGGNKPRELKTFAPMIEQGSLVAVHDWGTETLPKDVPDFLEDAYPAACDRMGSITRWFRKRP